jgi:GAF domain-containing protein
MGANPKTAAGYPRFETILALCSHRPSPRSRRSSTRLLKGTSVFPKGASIAHPTSAADRASLLEEQAALRRVATLVAQQASPDEVFTAVAGAVGPLLGADLTALIVCRGGDAGTTIAGWSASGPMLPIGLRLPLDGDGVTARIFRTGSSARMDSYVDVDGETADVARSLGLRSTVGAPVTVDGTLWGALMAATREAEPLPETTEERLATFTELVATAIANVHARSRLERIATEQEALRKAATLVASGAMPPEVFAQITASASDVFEVPFASLIRFLPDGTATMVAGCRECSAYVGMSWEVPEDDPGIARAVIRTGGPARVDDHGRVAGPVGEAARTLGVGSVVGAPVLVGGAIWGVLVVGAPQGGPPLAADVGERLVGFTELVTTTLINAEAREEVRSLLDEQETLRRVATSIAEGANPDVVFGTVCDEAVGLFGAEQAAVVRLETDGEELVVVGTSTGVQGVRVGLRSRLGEWPTTSAVCRTGRTARSDVTTEDVAGEGLIAGMVRAKGFLSSVAAPIVVDGRRWGAMTVSDSRTALTSDTERRIENFTDLIATAIENREAHDQVTRLVDEQAALRRVATLVAAGIEPDELFAAVSEEVAKLFEADGAAIGRFDSDGSGVVAVGRSKGLRTIPVGTRAEIDEWPTLTVVHRTRRAARWSDEFYSSVTAPITVAGRLWGVLTAGSGRVNLPSDTEERLEKFGELVATAIANAESRAELAGSEARARELANEQAALRRVATLAAGESAPVDVLEAVAHEAARVLQVDAIGMLRFEPDESAALVAQSETPWEPLPLGTRLSLDGENIVSSVHRTGRAARLDGWESATGSVAAMATALGVRSAVASPIVVEGRLWGTMVAATNGDTPLAADTESRIVEFTELLATAIASAENRTELLTSRARVVSAADEERRRLERNLHDGIQQWLVALALRARKGAGLSATGEPAAALLSGLADELVAVTDELREISRGIHPAILTDAGLDDALDSLARRSAIRVDLDVAFRGRYDPILEATVYYVVAESVTNSVKHAQASTVAVRGGLRDDVLEIEITDDGIGGADPRRGTGMVGLKDRVDTLGGTITFASPAGAGTMIRVRLPARPHEDGERSPRRSGEAASASASG